MGGGGAAAAEVELPQRLRRVVRVLPALCVLLFAAGVASLAYFPTDNFSSNTYLSENALLPAVADSSLSERSMEGAVAITAQYQRHLAHHSSLSPAARPSYSRWKAKWIVDQMEVLGLDDVHMHTFRANGKEGVNVVGVVKARRTSGREALVLTSRNDHFLLQHQLEPSAASSMAVGMAVMEHLAGVKWLSKDVIFVVTDDEHGDEGIRAWLKEYHSFGPTREAKKGKGEVRRQLQEKEHSVHRGGKIRGALVLDFLASDFSYISVCPEGVGGKLPNLDLLNAIDRVAAYGEQVYTTLLDVEDPATRFLYSQEHFVALDMPLRSLLLFMLHAAAATSTGDHGWFHQYNIDAVTLRLQPATAEQRHGVLRLARTVEGTVRCLSNLIEHLHQSFYYYLLSATFRYVSIGQYLVPFFAIVAAAVALPALNCALVALAPGASGKDILRAFARATIFSISGVALYYAGTRIPFLAAYSLCAVVAVLWAHKSERMFGRTAALPEGYVAGTAVLPSVMFLAPFALLRNFSFCFITAALFYPLFTLVTPVKGGGGRPLRKLQGFLAVLFSPPALLFAVVSAAAVYGTEVSVEELVALLFQAHVKYSSLVYPFLCLVYAPATLSLAAYNLFGV